jgi:hypothetical protein
MAIPITTIAHEADAFFMSVSKLHEAVRRLATALDDLGVDYAIAGALAANAHGLRTTEDVDVLMTRDGLATFKARWLGRGWVEKFAGSKGMRDAVAGVPIDVLLAGDFPGDGEPKPVVFPDPASVAERGPDGIPVLPLRTLLELKIASGMTAPHRPRDLDDAIRLIRVNALAEDYPVHPYVEARYRELWRLAGVADPD